MKFESPNHQSHSPHSLVSRPSKQPSWAAFHTCSSKKEQKNANAALKSLFFNKVFCFEIPKWSLVCYLTAVAFYFLKRMADITQGKAIELTEAINIFPKSCMINFPLISKADTVKEVGGAGWREALMMLNWASGDIPSIPPEFHCPTTGVMRTVDNAVWIIHSHCSVLFWFNWFPVMGNLKLTYAESKARRIC